MRKNNIKKWSNRKKIGIVFFFVFILVGFFFSFFSSKITPRLVHVAELSIEKYIKHNASDFKLFILEKNNSDHFLNILENKDGEIVSIDYEMAKIYQIADELTNYLEENIFNSQELNSYLSKNTVLPNNESGILLFLPFGVASNSVFLANLGPKIPILARFIGSVFSSVKTRVTDYGINNVLLDIYLEVTVSYEILTPITMEEKEFTYELLLDSKVIQGKVPNFYNGVLENQSAFFEVPFP